MSLLSLEMAKGHVRVTDDQALADLQTKLEQAEAIVLDYIARPSDATWTATVAGWTETTVPLQVQAAILRVCANLYRFRGDDDGKDRDWSAERDGFLSPDVTCLLRRYRDPVLA